jgi:hypothetical protein
MLITKIRQQLVEAAGAIADDQAAKDAADVAVVAGGADLPKAKKKK